MKQKCRFKIKVTAAVLTSVLLFGVCSAAIKAGMLAVQRGDVESYDGIEEVLRNDKKKYNTILGDVFDRNDDYIMDNNEIIINSANEYDPAYTYILGSPMYNIGLLNRHYDTLTDKSYTHGKKGLNIRLTIDDSLQKFLYSLTEGKRKSIVIMEKNSGKILAMTGAYEDPFTLSNVTGKMIEEYNNYDPAHSPVWLTEYMNCYHTGSVMKIFTSAVAFDTGYGGFTLQDWGSTSFNGKIISDSYSADGSVEDIESAFVKSSNVYFSTLGVTIGADTIKLYIDKFLLNTTIETDFGRIENKSLLKKRANDHAIGSFCYGQGGTYSTVTLCMLAQAATTGRIYRPHIIDSIFCYDDEEEEITVRETKEEILSENIISPFACEEVDRIMKASASSKGLAEDVGVKSGTAEIYMDNHDANRATMIGTYGNYVIAISEISLDEVLFGSSHTSTMKLITDVLRQY